jgi:RNA polymerase sigma-B factor
MEANVTTRLRGGSARRLAERDDGALCTVRAQPTDHDADEGLVARYAIDRDPVLRDRIVERHQWLVTICARQMQRSGESLDDLVQVANMGLLHALEHFDLAFGVKFRTYASATMSGVLRRHYRSTWRIRVPRRLQEMHLHVCRAVDDLTSELRRSPTTAEVAQHLRVGEEDVLEALELGWSRRPSSISGPAADRGASASLAADDPDVERVDDRVDVERLLGALSPRDAQILRMRFYDGSTQSEIGDEIGLSQVQVSRLIRGALTRLAALV